MVLGLVLEDGTNTVGGSASEHDEVRCGSTDSVIIIMSECASLQDK